MKRLVACVAVVLVVTPAAGWADCVDGTRSGTSEEQTFARQLSESLKAAMPAAPAPLYLEREPEVIMGTVCKDTPANEIGGLVMANYTASPNYSDRVKLTVRANFQFPGKYDLVLGTLPKNSSGLKVYNLVVQVDGYNAQYIESVKQAVDRARLQAMIDQPLPATPAPAAWRVGTTPPTATASTVATGPAAAQSTEPTAPGPEPAPAQTDVAKQTNDAVKKLRGLLGQ